MNADNTLWIVAGPPGAGKTALARTLFPGWAERARVIDADDPANPGSGGGLRPRHGGATALDRRIEDAVVQNQSFAIESRLAMREPLSTALRLRRAGWQTGLVYIALPRIDLCRERIMGRVMAGGEDIDEDILTRDFQTALANLPGHIDAAARWILLDGTGSRAANIAEGAHAGALIHQPDVFRALLPDYPAMPAASSVREDRWASAVLKAFAKVSARCRTLDRLLRLAGRLDATSGGE